jgi:hypothetical protein
MGRVSFLSLAVFLALGTAAFAQDCSGLAIGGHCIFGGSTSASPLATQNNLLEISHASQLPLVNDDLYRVLISCSRYSSRRYRGWEPFRENVSTTHFIALTNAPAGPTEVPKDVKAATTVFSVSGDQKDRKIYINKKCEQQFILSGRDRLYLLAIANQTTTEQPSALVSAAFDLIGIAAPLLPLFQGTALASTVLGDVSKTQDPLSKLLSLFDKGTTVTRVDDLFQGSNVITTPYSRVTLNVSKIKSLVGLNNNDITNAYENSMGEAKKSLNPDSITDLTALAQKCGELENGLRNENLSTEDISYGIVLLTRLAALDQTKTLACMGKDYALPGLQHVALWQRFGSQNYSEDDVRSKWIDDSARPAQPDFAEAKPKLQEAVRLLGRYTQTDGLKSDGLDAVFADQISVINTTDLFSSDISEGKLLRADFLSNFVKGNFIRVGCLTSDTQSLAFFLAFKSSADAMKTNPPDAKVETSSDAPKEFKDSDAIIIREWFDKDHRIGWTNVDYDVGLVEKALQQRGTRVCGEDVTVVPLR